MNQYIYFALGIVLGISLAVYYFMNREEKIEKLNKLDQKNLFYTKIRYNNGKCCRKTLNKKIKEIKKRTNWRWKKWNNWTML